MKAFRVSSMVALAVAAALSGCAATQDAAQSAVSSVKSLAGQAQVTRQALAPALYEVAYSPSQDVVYVVSAGGFGPDAPASKVLRLDPKTLDVKGEIPLSTNGFGLVLDDAAHRLYITDTRAGSLTVVDVAHDTVVGTVALNEAPDAVPGQKPAKASQAAKAAKASRTDRTAKAAKASRTDRTAKAAGEDKDGLYKYREVVLDRTHNRLYLPGMSLEAGSDGVLKVVDAHTLKVQKVVPGLGFGTTGIALDEAAGKLYVSNLVGQLFVVDTGTLAVTQKFEVAADQLLNLAVDRAAGQVLAVDQGMARLDEKRQQDGIAYTPRGKGNQVVAIDPANGQVTRNIAVGTQPVALLLDAERNRLYVSNRDSGNVSIIDARTGHLLKSVDLQRHPNSLTLNPKTGEVYVTIKNARDAARGSDESVARIQY